LATLHYAADGVPEFPGTADSTRVATLETYLDRKPRVAPTVMAEQLAGPGNANPSPRCSVAKKALLHHFADHPAAIDGYMDWQWKMESKSMDQRLANALVRPIITALNACRYTHLFYA
jgi:hypothetical protein